MPVQVVCPHCKHAYSLADSFIGRNIRCLRCRAHFTAEAEKPRPEAPSATIVPHQAPLWIGVLLVASFVAAALYFTQRPTANFSSGTVSVDAETLHKNYKTDRKGGDQLYRDKTLVVSGTVRRVEAGATDRFLSLKTDGEPGIYCFFSEKNRPALVHVRPNQTVFVVGNCRGIDRGFITLDDCLLTGR